MRPFVLSAGALLTVVLVVLAAHIFWRELVRLGRERRSDRWAEDVQTWQ